MPSKWNPEVIVQFLGIYKSYKSLWNPKEVGYGNKRLRMMETDKLVKELRDNGIEIEDVDYLRKKIKIIKAVYRQELIKIENSIERDDPKLYVPKLVWFKNANYLKSYLSIATAELKLDPSAVKSPQCGNMIQMDEQECFNSSQARIEDEYDNFGKYVAAQLRQLPVRSFILLQEKIQSLVTKERFAAMESDSITPVTVHEKSLDENSLQKTSSDLSILSEHTYAQDNP